MDDTISLSFFTQQNLRQKQLGQRLLKLLLICDEAFSPEYISVGERWEIVDEEDVEQLAQWWPKQINVSMERRRRFESAVAVSMGRAASGYNSLSFWLDARYFENQDNLNRFLEFSIDLYQLLSPAYGYIHPTKDALTMSTIEDDRYGTTVVPINLGKGLPDVYWGNFFGPEYVSLIGKTILLQLGGYRETELADGGLLVLTTQTPLQLDRDIQAQVKNEIGRDFFYEWGQSASGKTL